MHITDTPVHTYIHMAIAIAVIIYSPMLVMIMTIIVLITILMMITKIIIYPEPNYIPACKIDLNSILISHCKNINSVIYCDVSEIAK